MKQLILGAKEFENFAFMAYWVVAQVNSHGSILILEKHFYFLLCGSLRITGVENNPDFVLGLFGAFSGTLWAVFPMSMKTEERKTERKTVIFKP